MFPGTNDIARWLAFPAARTVPYRTIERVHRVSRLRIILEEDILPFDTTLGNVNRYPSCLTRDNANSLSFSLSLSLSLPFHVYPRKYFLEIRLLSRRAHKQ